MTRRIAVRVPDVLAAYIDDLVGTSRAISRASVVIRALERGRRRELAERDIAILTGTSADRDTDELAQYGRQVRLDDLD